MAYALAQDVDCHRQVQRNQEAVKIGEGAET